ncbi:DUF1643 domain-containing protein [Lysinibacillus sp. NPDC094403]|uniref:DUF1643 domain-containing protein n=1 Tax=Lysinibacillus sp. NPDC094403 TaxID=3390581 RepID=UPI003D06A355
MASKPKSLQYYRIVNDDSINNYRYLLSFESRNNPISESVSIILMNPSKAGLYNNVEKVDRTIGKVLCWCNSNGYNKVDILNLFPYREPDPENLIELNSNILLGDYQKCNQIIKDTCDTVDKIIIAWGNCEGIVPSIVKERVEYIFSIIDINKVYHVGEKTETGNPRHGRMWNGNPTLNKW